MPSKCDDPNNERVDSGKYPFRKTIMTSWERKIRLSAKAIFAARSCGDTFAVYEIPYERGAGEQEAAARNRASHAKPECCGRIQRAI